MAEPTPTDMYHDFCDEDALLTASIAALESSPALDTLDDLSAAVTRRERVRAQLPTLCAASERYEHAQRQAALVALHAPRWATAASAKVTALGTITTLLGQLATAQAAYAAAHGSQLSTLLSLPYSAPYRTNYGPMPGRLAQIIDVIVKGDGSWMSQLATFDALGMTATLPDEA